MKIIYNDGHVAECPAEEELEVLRHSAAHIMAQAVKRLYPDAHFAYGPATEKGFHYDIDLGDVKLTDEDLPALQAEMQAFLEFSAVKYNSVDNQHTFFSSLSPSALSQRSSGPVRARQGTEAFCLSPDKARGHALLPAGKP